MISVFLFVLVATVSPQMIRQLMFFGLMMSWLADAKGMDECFVKDFHGAGTDVEDLP